LKFLHRIMDDNEHLIGFLQRAIGYTLTGSARERALLLLHGSGANGKSTLIETVSAMLGDHAKSTRAETLMVKTYDTAIPNDIAALKGARMVSTSETEEGKRLAEALVKNLTGGDSISARFLRGEYFTFRAAFKLWLATNHKPTIRGTDRAIWDRIRLVPFNVRIPDEEQDKELPGKLLEELPGILAWAMQGCLQWQKTGLGTPAEVQAATDSYRAEMDILASFIEDRCVVADGARATSKELWGEYQSWCQETGEHAGKQKTFGMRLEEKGLKPGRSKSERFWVGIGLLGREVQSTLNVSPEDPNSSSGDTFSNVVTHGDANPGLTGL
jgi:putative DNA primase/helicase